jgi:hypothetical protein
MEETRRAFKKIARTLYEERDLMGYCIVAVSRHGLSVRIDKEACVGKIPTPYLALMGLKMQKEFQTIIDQIGG